MASRNFLLTSFRLHCGPGVDSASNRNEYQEYFLGGKGGRCVGLTLPPTCATVLKSGSLSLLETSWPVQACNGIALTFTQKLTQVKVLIFRKSTGYSCKDNINLFLDLYLRCWYYRCDSTSSEHYVLQHTAVMFVVKTSYMCQASANELLTF